MKRYCFLVVVLGLLAVLGIPDSQAVYILSDGNSQAGVNEDGGSMFFWEVDGINHLFEQWFWYRVGDTGPEKRVNSTNLDLGTSGATDTNFDGYDETLFLTYVGSDFTIELTFVLTGGPSDSDKSDIAEVISITNTSATALDFHFYQYTDFDLGGFLGDTVVKKNANTFHQEDPYYVAGEVVGTPAPSRWEAGLFPSTLNRLNDGVATDLNNSSGPATGDATFAWQWDMGIAAGDALVISKDKNITPVPEPGTLLLLGSGLLGLAVYTRRRRKES